MRIELYSECAGLAYPAVTLVYLFLTRKILDFYTRRKFGEAEVDSLEERSNPGAGLRLAGFYLAVSFGMAGSLTGSSRGFLTDLASLALSGLILTSILFLAWIISKKLFLCRIDNDAAIRDGNASVGAVEAGCLISAGLIASGSFSGDGGGYLPAIVFFLIGQVSLYIFFALASKLTPFDENREIENGNIAAGVYVAGLLVSLSIILGRAVTGEFRDWFSDLSAFGFYALKGIIVLLVLGFIADAIIFRRHRIMKEIGGDRNLPAAIIAVCVRIGIALTVSYSV